MKKLKLAAVRRFNRTVKTVANEIRNAGHSFCLNKPNIVLSLGGDGTFLASERKYPEIAKVMIKDSEICKRCGEDDLIRVLNKLSNNQYKVIKLLKIEAKISNKKTVLLGVNDIVIRNTRMTRALRFNLYVNNKLTHKIIGDGIIASTPFGAQGYFYSATRKTFSKGWAIGFNNSVKPIKPIYLSEKDVVKIEVIRHTASICADNDTNIINAKEKEIITLKISKKKATIYDLR